MIPVAAVTVSAATVATSNDGAHSPADNAWGVPAISPGNTSDNSNLYRGWKQLWVENNTDVRIDVGIITQPSTNAAATILAAAKTVIAQLASGDKIAWDWGDNDCVAGPVYLRGTSSDPASGNVYLGGMAG